MAFVVAFKVLATGSELKSDGTTRSHVTLIPNDQVANKDSVIELYASGATIGASVVPGQVISVSFT
jgi:hypothetical protein